MGIEKNVGKTALELAQNENIVNKTTDFLGMLFPFIGLKKKALDMYLSDIENSNLEDRRFEKNIIELFNYIYLCSWISLWHHNRSCFAYTTNIFILV